MLIITSLVMVLVGASMQSEQVLIKQLKMEEGFRNTPYRDSRGYWTIGYGFNLSGRALTKQEHYVLFPNEPYPMPIEHQIEYWRNNPMSQEHAEFLLEEAIGIAVKDAVIIFEDHFNLIPTEKRVPILDMLYNLGRTKFKKFRKCIKAIENKDWSEAGKQVRESLAYHQAPTRYERIAREFEK